MPKFAVDRLRDVALAARVLDQEDFARADDAGLAVAGGDFHRGVEIDDVLPPRRRVPVISVTALGGAKDDAGRGKARGDLAAGPNAFGLDLDIAEMGLAIVVGIEVMDVHHGLSVLVRGSGEANAEDRAERNGDGVDGNAGSRRHFICLHGRCLPVKLPPDYTDNRWAANLGLARTATLAHRRSRHCEQDAALTAVTDIVTCASPRSARAFVRPACQSGGASAVPARG
jgi:hypothetical protein